MSPAPVAGVPTIRIRERRASDPCQPDEAERALVLRILRADLAWLEERA